MEHRLRRFAILALPLALSFWLASCASDGAPSRRRFEDLTNPLLGPEYTSYLIGAISKLASDEEILAFLALRDDAQAEQWVEAFWERRDLTPNVADDNPLRRAYEARAEEADRRYSEGGFRGRRTARGAVFVLYGPPQKVEFDIAPTASSSAIEQWTYPTDAGVGLDGRRPNGIYRFIKIGDLTVPYSSTTPLPRSAADASQNPR